MFLHLSVILCTGRGVSASGPGEVSSTSWADTPWADPPWADTPLGRHPQVDTLLGRHPPGQNPHGQTPPRQIPPGQIPPGQTPLRQTQCMLGYGQRAGSMHPSEMHSCLPQENMMNLYDVDTEVALCFKDFSTTKFLFLPLNWQESVMNN